MARSYLQRVVALQHYRDHPCLRDRFLQASPVEHEIREAVAHHA
jgi:hypothetical protein